MTDDRRSGSADTEPIHSDDDGGLTERALASPRRRAALAVLVATETPMTLPTLADEVTIIEHDGPISEFLDERLWIYMSLYHDHIPVLEAAGLVVYAQSGDVVDLGEQAATIDDRIPSVDELKRNE